MSTAAMTNATVTIPEPIDFLGMPIHPVDFGQAVELILALARSREPAYVVTANVDHIVRFSQNADVHPLYTGADLNVADGMPVIVASRLLGTPLPERVAGSDLFPALCARAADEGLSVFFLGGDPGAAERARDVLVARYPSLRVAGTHCPDYGFEKHPEKAAAAVSAVKSAAPDLLFVGLGSPKQERWIVDNLDACEAGVSIGVGISFSFVGGDVTRAPRWIQRIGLEWAHRLVQEPRRLWRRYLVEDTAFFGLVLREAWRRRRTGTSRF